jgi:diguanylate cyclase (GGDEF)-like protein
LINSVTLDSLEENLKFFYKMYDIVRLVDPVNKTVTENKASCSGEANELCYTYWRDDKICDNCISVRAYLQNKCYIKLEQSAETIMMVTALPVENSEKPMVIELLKNATDSMMIGTGDYAKGHLMRRFVTEINELVVRDELTGQYNRRYVNERLPADIVRATLEKEPLSVIFVDVDNLKNINDCYGHVCGDQAITKVMEKLLCCIRSDTDWAARYGGDEFFICLNRTGKKAACHVAERIRKDVEEIVIFKDGKSVKTTVSLGVYTMEAERGEMLTADEVIALADRRMYEAKKNGRNHAFAGPDGLK